MWEEILTNKEIVCKECPFFAKRNEENYCNLNKVTLNHFKEFCPFKKIEE